MLKVLKMLIFMFGVYFLIQIGFAYFGDGHEVVYEIKNGENKFLIREKLTHNVKDEANAYYIEVKLNDTVFPFQVYEDMNSSKTIITNIEYYKDDNYECILPIFRGGKVLKDIMCIKDNVVVYYNTLNLKTEAFETFLASLSTYSYDATKFQNNVTGVEMKNFADLYTNNIQEGYFGALTHYIGIYTIANETTDPLNKVVLFNNGDVYNQEISGFVGKIFVIASYNNETEFSDFITVDCKSSAVVKIETNYRISYNSYVQGIQGNSIFIYDRDNKIQYEVNVKDKKVIKNNAENGITYYENGVKSNIEVTDDKDIYFKNEKEVDYENDRYFNIIKEGNKETGYYYLFKKNNNKVEIYRMNVKNTDVVTYIGSANEVRDIKFIDDYIYFIDGNNINFFSDRSGFRTMLTAKELSFNKTIKYDIFKK